MNNADRIRAMSDEELAEFILNINYCEYCLNYGAEECGDCIKGKLKWLQSEVKESEEE